VISDNVLGEKIMEGLLESILKILKMLLDSILNVFFIADDIGLCS